MAIEGDSIQFGPWYGGVNYALAAEDCEPDQISSMENCRIGLGGYIEKRDGSAKYESYDALGSAPAIFMSAEFRIPGGSTYNVIIAADGNVYYDNGSAWTDISGAATISTTSDDHVWDWVRAHDTLVMTNGVNTALKWTGTGDVATITMPSGVSWAKYVAYWDDRVWLANTDADDDRIWYSDKGTLDTWGSTSYYQLGSPITAATPFQNLLTVHTEEGIWTLTPTGNAQVPYQRQPATQQSDQSFGIGGSVSNRAVISLPDNRQLFILPGGIYQWTGGEEIEKISQALDEGYWPNLTTSRLHMAHAIYYPVENEVWFWLPYAEATTMNHVIVYNTQLESWYGPYTGIPRNCSCIVDNKPHAGGYDGIFYDHAPSVYTDDGTAISAYFTTSGQAPEGGDVRVRWQYGRVYYDNVGAYNVTIDQELSGLNGASNVLQTLAGGVALGSFTLDQDALASIRMQSDDIELEGYDPHSTLNFANTGSGEYFRIRRVYLQYKSIGRKRKAAKESD